MALARAMMNTPGIVVERTMVNVFPAMIAMPSLAEMNREKSAVPMTGLVSQSSIPKCLPRSESSRWSLGIGSTVEIRYPQQSRLEQNDLAEKR